VRRANAIEAQWHDLHERIAKRLGPSIHGHFNQYLLVVVAGQMQLRLRVTDVMPPDAFWEQTFPAALPPTGQRRTAAFGPHSGTETVLPFACALGWLVSPFHKIGNRFACLESGYTRGERGLVNDVAVVLIYRFETRSLPARSPRPVAALPSMSLIPLAPFAICADFSDKASLIYKIASESDF
jgi:hypothetical protein